MYNFNFHSQLNKKKEYILANSNKQYRVFSMVNIYLKTKTLRVKLIVYFLYSQCYDNRSTLIKVKKKKINIIVQNSIEHE